VPDKILIIDASLDNATELAVKDKEVKLPVFYYKVEDEHRGLTRQRNYSISRLDSDTEIVSFLDDDIVLEPDYFEEIEKAFADNKDAIGIGGVDLKDNSFFKKETTKKYPKFNYYEIDGWVMKEPLRNKVRKIFGLMPDINPGLIPEYSNGRSSLPPNGKIYEVEHFIGMSMSFRRTIFDYIRFSSFFEGYGLYEDFDFCVRALPYGRLYVNTKAKVWHYHEASGRPNLFRYGKMVVRNGWYVWRVRYPEPSVKAKFQWHLIMFLLAVLRLFNFFLGPDRKDAIQEYCGRTSGWFSLWFNKPDTGV
jgi:GT2 family glycosyltransferase